MTNITTDRVGHPGDRTLTMDELRVASRAAQQFDSLQTIRKSVSPKGGTTIQFGKHQGLQISFNEFDELMTILIENRVTHLTSLGIKVGPIGLVTPEHCV